MKIWLLISVFISAALCSACNQGTGINTTTNPQPTAAMSASQFTSLTRWVIKAGDSVRFNDPAQGGGVHNLVTGHDGNYIAQPGAPDIFNNSGGQNFNPGDSMLVKFPSVGTYTITCTIHDAMLLTIIVQP